MSGMNPGFAAYLARKKAGKTAPNTNLAPKSVITPGSKVDKNMERKLGIKPGSPADKKMEASGFGQVAKRHSKVMTAPKNLKHGKYL
jgi:hypothetical protein